MMLPPVIQANSTYTPSAAPTGLSWKQIREPAGNEPPRKPDWLLIIVLILFLITIMIAWFINRPDL